MANVHSDSETKYRDAQLDIHLDPMGKVESLFDWFENAEPILDLEPEVLKKPGKWLKTNVKGVEIYKVDGEKRFNNV